MLLDQRRSRIQGLLRDQGEGVATKAVTPGPARAVARLVLYITCRAALIA